MSSDQRRAALIAASEAFTACPDPSGPPGAPCNWGDYFGPVIERDGLRFKCPIYQTVNCEPHRRDVEERRKREEKAQRREWIEEGLRRGIPRRDLDVSFDKLDHTPAVDRARRYAERRETGFLFLIGPVGTGKTNALEAVVRAWPQRAVFVSAVDLARALVRPDERADALELLEAPMLALDDYGQEYAPKEGFVAEIFEELFTRRHAEMLPTLVSTNLSVAALRKRLGVRVWDRLRVDGEVLELTGPSLRRRRNAQ